MEKYIEGEIVVKFRDGTTPAEAETAIAAFGLLVKNWFKNVYLVEVPVGSEEKWTKKFKKLASVKFAQRNGIMSLPKPWRPQQL